MNNNKILQDPEKPH